MKETAMPTQSSGQPQSLSTRADTDTAFTHRLLDAIRTLQSRYISGDPLQEIFNQFVVEVLRLTESEYAFVGEVLIAEDGHAFLKIHDISHIARDEATRRFFQAHAPSGAEFHNLNNLFGYGILHKKPVIANEPRQDPRWGGRQPHGHPPMHNFLGLPLMVKDEAIGLVGIANRTGGYSESLVEALQPVLSACSTILQAHRDARSRKLAEAAFNESSRLYQVLAEKSSEATAIVDKERRFKFASPSTQNVLGYAPAFLLGKPVLELVHPDDLGLLADTLERIAGGELHETRVEFRFLHQDGTFLWVESLAVGRFDDPAIGGIVCNYRDISDRMRTLVALRESEARFRTLSESVPVILWTTAGDGKIEYINKYWFEYSGLESKVIQTDKWRESLHPEDVAGFISAWNGALEARHPFIHEYRIRRASDRSYRWHLARAVPVYGPDGLLSKWLGTSVDIHDQKEFSDLVRIKEELERQKRLMEAVLDTMSDGLIVSDADGKYLVYNKEAARLLSFSRQEVEQKREELTQQIKVYHEDGKTPMLPEDSPTKKALRGEQVSNECFLMEGPYYPGGLWLNVSSRSLPWEDKPAAVAVFQDVTLKKKAEILTRRHADAVKLGLDIQSILTSPGTLSEVLASALGRMVAAYQGEFAHVWLMAPGGQHVELAGFTGKFPMPSGTFRIGLHEGKVGQVARSRTPVFTNSLLHDPISLFPDWVRENGIVAFAGWPLIAQDELLGVLSLFSKSPLEDHVSENLGSVAFLFAEGIQRRQAQDALLQSEERFRTLVEGVQDYAIFMLETDGRIASWNSGAERITGYKHEEIREQRFGFLYTPSDRESGVPEADLRNAESSGRFETEGRRFAKGGKVFWATVHLSAIRNPDGSLKGFAHVIRDISEKRRMDEALKERSRELEALNRELEAFSYSVSHDLRAPLRSMDGFSRALEDTLGARLDEAGRMHLSRIRNASGRMGTLIDALLDLSRLNRVVMVEETVDLTGLCEQAIQDLSEGDPGRNPKIEIEKSLSVRGDRNLLERLITNLLGNAWKFTAPVPDASIRVGRSLQQGREVFYVKDNGVGFDMAFASKLFGAFQRLHSQSEFQGTGIGLALSYRIVKRHHGDIWAESSPGRGAAFYFTLASERKAI